PIGGQSRIIMNAEMQLPVPENLATIHKSEPAQGPIRPTTREGELQFCIHDDAGLTADGIFPRYRIHRKRGAAIAAHGTDAARIKVLEYRIRLAAQSATVVQF